MFPNELDLVFYAQQRIYEGDKSSLFPLFSNVFLNPAVSFIGINASGKTSVLNVIQLVTDILNNKSINHSSSKAILGNTDKAIITTYYYSNNHTVCKLETVIVSSHEPGDGIRYSISDEALSIKPEEDVLTRKTLTDFSGITPQYVRDRSEEYLPEDVSIIIAHNRRTNDALEVQSMLRYTDINFLPLWGDISTEIIQFLDPTIESIHLEGELTSENKTIRVKFKGKEEIILHNILDLNNYLSSGTIKGIAAFTMAWVILENGGMLIVDEIENHFNKEIVSSLIRFFMDTSFNKNGAVLIYSTHYPELLDEYDRNDSIYITKNISGITAENLNSLIKRNDIKKSDAYQSGLLNGTTPSYEAYIKLKKSFANSMKQE